MSDLKKVYHGMAGSIKGKLKTPLLVYENKDDAKEFANNYTDLNKEPKVLQFDLDLEINKVLDLTTEKGKEKFEKLIKEEGLEQTEIINHKKEYFDDEDSEVENLDTLSWKKILKVVSENFDAVKGYSILDKSKVPSYSILNTEILINKEVLEIDLEGNLWKVEFKK